ncbi:MAG: type II toxin-antitoxin system PrlF family antitoxin [Paucimonas sp.]|jgi:antitoxin PrlF|nr:type II toxin-antitoxin system PrlF family antitoxin [Paucimonas sp.]
MAEIHEIATLTSKGQVTVPKSVRQLLGLGTGGKIAFDVRAGEVVVSRVDTPHEDPAIGAFLSLLEADIRAGRNLHALPQDLADVLLANASHPVDFDDDIEGEVSL